MRNHLLAFAKIKEKCENNFSVSQPGVRGPFGIPGEAPGDPQDFQEYFFSLWFETR